MFARILTALYLSLALVFPALAEQDTPISKPDLVNLIVANDIDGVESELANVHRLFLIDAATADQSRIVYEPFGVVNPKTSKFVERWLAKHPGSPYAHAAQAWLYYKAAWTLRGTSLACDTYPDAMRYGLPPA